jgi:hypothetical protein
MRRRCRCRRMKLGLGRSPGGNGARVIATEATPRAEGPSLPSHHHPLDDAPTVRIPAKRKKRCKKVAAWVGGTPAGFVVIGAVTGDPKTQNAASVAAASASRRLPRARRPPLRRRPRRTRPQPRLPRRRPPAVSRSAQESVSAPVRTRPWRGAPPARLCRPGPGARPPNPRRRSLPRRRPRPGRRPRSLRRRTTRTAPPCGPQGRRRSGGVSPGTRRTSTATTTGSDARHSDAAHRTRDGM